MKMELLAELNWYDDEAHCPIHQCFYRLKDGCPGCEQEKEKRDES